MLRPNLKFDNCTALPENTIAGPLLCGVNSDQALKVSAMSSHPKTKDASVAQPKLFCANTLCQGQCFLSQSPDIRDDVSPTAGDQIAQNYPVR